MKEGGDGRRYKKARTGRRKQIYNRLSDSGCDYLR